MFATRKQTVKAKTLAEDMTIAWTAYDKPISWRLWDRMVRAEGRPAYCHDLKMSPLQVVVQSRMAAEPARLQIHRLPVPQHPWISLSRLEGIQASSMLTTDKCREQLMRAMKVKGCINSDWTSRLFIHSDTG